MESARAPGTAVHDLTGDPEEDYSPLTDGHGGFVDISTLSGTHGQLSHLDTSNLYDDDFIGISMSRVQTQMRSPTTPAAEKARVMDLPVDYFQRISILDQDSEDESPGHDTERRDSDSVNGAVKPPMGPQEPNIECASQETARQGLVCSSHAALCGENVRDHRTVDSSVLPVATLSAPISLPEKASADQPWVDHRTPQVRQDPHTSLVVNQGEQSFQSSESTSSQIANENSQRASVTKDLLSGVGSERRRSFGSELFANLRKYLPDLPPSQSAKSSITLLPFSTKGHESRNSVSGSTTPTSRSSRWSLRLPEMSSVKTSAENMPGHGGADPMATNLPQSQLDGNAASLLSPTRPGSAFGRQRSNSESSLYLRRRVSGISAFDDVSAFAHVTDMANSRFKAITDSFQNSTIKFPRLPVVRPGLRRRTTSEEERARPRNTAGTTGERSHNHAYTTVKGLRNAAKGAEVETPQQRAHPVLSHALSKATGDLVILGGYRGSILRSAKPPHRQLWVPIKVGLNLRKVDLEVGLTREDEERMEDTIIPSGILSHIGPIDICRRLLKHLHKCPNARDNRLRVHNYGYDWRLSPEFLSDKLIEFLESLESNHPETPPEKRGATVIAHSLGGLITRHAVNRRPDLFAGVVYAGTPQHCVNILGPLRNGDDVMLSSRVLTAQVNFTIRTSFALLPESGRCFIDKDTNERYDVDFFDPQTWDEYRLSPCINPPLPRLVPEKPDRRKSIIAVLSNGVSGTHKRGGSAPNLLPQQDADEGSPDAADARRTMNELEMQDSEGNAGGMVGPGMKQSSQRPAVATAVTIPRDAAKEYLERTLAGVSRFKRNLHYIPDHQENNVYPPHSFIFGKTVPTVYGARVASREAIKYSDVFDDLAFAAGDGVVLASAAQLPEGYRCVKGGRVESDRGHVGLMGDLEGMGRCIEAIIDARAKGVGLGQKYARHDS